MVNYNNFGFAKFIVSNKLGSEFLSEGVVKSSGLAGKFLKVIKNSEVLREEFKIFENLENKHITNDALAIRYINENIKQFSKYSKEDFIEAHNNLDGFIDESFIEIPEKKKLFFEALNLLLYQSTKNGDEDVNTIHDSFEVVLEYVKSNVKVIEENNSILLDENIDLDDIIKRSMKKFNEKFNSLDEEERVVLNKIVYGNSNEKKNLFETLKTENLELLSSIEKNGIEDKIHETIVKINKMKYDDSSVKDILCLVELKGNLS